MYSRSLMYFALFGAMAHAAQPIIRCDFETSEEGWVARGSRSAHVHVSGDRVKDGSRALVLEFEASRSEPASIRLPIQNLQGMRSMNLWLMAESTTAATVSLIEKQGSRFEALVWLEPKVWHKVELMPEDFILTAGTENPKRPEDRLDLDQIEAIEIKDLSQILNAFARRPDSLCHGIPFRSPEALSPQFRNQQGTSGLVAPRLVL